VTDDYYVIDARSSDAIGGGVVTTVRLNGEFDLGAAGDLRAALLGAVKAGPTGRVVVDLAEVTFIDSETVRVLLDGYAAAQAQGTGYRLDHPRGMVERVLAVMGLTQLQWVGES
jgi:anti-anti-sigma factor